MKLVLSILVSLLLAHVVAAKDTVSVIPRPLKMDTKDGSYRILGSTTIYHTKGAEPSARFLAEELRPATGFELPLKQSKRFKPGVYFQLLDEDEFKLGKEAYELNVDGQGIRIRASSQAGLFYGAQTLRQLLPIQIFASKKISSAEWTVPFLNIEDKPRFSWRGMHLDVARYYMPKEFVLRFIDLIALHKMNTFHWHLTEDQGWRLEIKKYPRLTEIAGWRDETVVGNIRYHMQNKLPYVYDGVPHGGYYTQEEVKEIVAYAAERHITVVPEVELPGHSQAALYAYPEYASTDEEVGVKREWGVSHYIYSPEEKTIEFLKDIFDEVLELFPSKYIHIGGDEAKKTLWETSERIQALRKKRGLKDMNEMQSWFIQQFDDYLVEKGRILIGWDEILEGGLADGATVMSWRGAKGGIAAAKAGHDVVMAEQNFLYFDHYQMKSESEPIAIGGFTTLEDVYGYEPIPAELSKAEAKHILGAQGQLWTEYMPHEKHVEYMAFPRTCALAEVLWLPPGEKDFSSFEQDMKTHYKRLAMLRVNFRPAYRDEHTPQRPKP